MLRHLRRVQVEMRCLVASRCRSSGKADKLSPCCREAGTLPQEVSSEFHCPFKILALKFYDSYHSRDNVWHFSLNILESGWYLTPVAVPVRVWGKLEWCRCWRSPRSVLRHSERCNVTMWHLLKERMCKWRERYEEHLHSLLSKEAWAWQPYLAEM